MFDAQVHEFYFINVRISVSYRTHQDHGLREIISYH